MGDAGVSFISVGGAALDCSAEGGSFLVDSTLDITGGIAAGDVSVASREGARSERKARRLDASFKVTCDV